MSDDNGYRAQAGETVVQGHGPKVRTDIVDVYVFRRKRGAGSGGAMPGEHHLAGVEFLQLYRSGEPMGRTWQPVMGHVERGETAPRCAARELREEIGLGVSGDWKSGGPAVGMWALEQVHPYYIAAIDSIVMSPRFAVEVEAGWEPTLNDEHTAMRWVPWSEVWRRFMWPGQAAACQEIMDHLLRPSSLSRDALAVGEGLLAAPGPTTSAIAAQAEAMLNDSHDDHEADAPVEPAGETLRTPEKIGAGR